MASEVELMEKVRHLLPLGLLASGVLALLPSEARSASFSMAPDPLVLAASESTLTFDFIGVAPGNWSGGPPGDVSTLTLRVTTEAAGAHLQSFVAAPLVPFDPAGGAPFPDFVLLNQEASPISGGPNATSALGELAIECPTSTCVLDVSYFMGWNNDPPRRFAVTRTLGSSAPFPVQSAQADLSLPEASAGSLALMGLLLAALRRPLCLGGRLRGR